MAKKYSFTVGENKVFIGMRIDPVLAKIVGMIMVTKDKHKTDIVEEALWDYVEKQGFTKDDIIRTSSTQNIEVTGPDGYKYPPKEEE